MALTDLTPVGSGDSPLAGGSTPQTTPSQVSTSTQPTSTPQFSGPSSSTQAAQAVMSEMNQPQPTQAAPVYTPPTLAGQPSFFGKLLQGALNGLAGGLAQGQTNIAGAGTPGFTPVGGGLSYAQKLQQQQDQKQAEADKAKQDTAQQDFENQQKTFQMNQQAQLQKVQAAQAKLSGIHLEQQIQHADEDAQNKYYAGQEDQRQMILDGGGKEIAHLKVAAGQSMQDVGAAYIKENPGLMADPNVHLSYSRDADGETEVHVMSGDPNARISAEDANSQLKSIGSERTLAPDTTMTRHDFTRLYGDEAGKVADQHNASKVSDIKFQREQQLEAQKEAAARQLEGIRESGEDRRAATKANGGGDDIVKTMAEGIADGSGQTLDQIAPKQRAAVQAYLTEHHPNLDQSSVTTTGAMRGKQQLANTVTQNLDDISEILSRRPDLVGSLNSLQTRAKTAVGSNDNDLAKLQVALDNYGLASVGIHGSRAVKNKEEAANALLNSYKSGPQAAQAAIDEAKRSAVTFGRTPTSRDGSAYIVTPKPTTQGQQLTDPGVIARYFHKYGSAKAATAAAEKDGWNLSTSTGGK
jgi:hypothetical protein